jgi:uncharacterized protein YeaO (DUF488 family)
VAEEDCSSSRLRNWFGRDSERWKEFPDRYFAEIEEKDSVEEFVKEDGLVTGLAIVPRAGIRIAEVLQAQSRAHSFLWRWRVWS